MYGASKAALTNAGECWRLELAPLGVRVITLITGGVTTKFLENIQPITLPDASYYHSVKDIIEKQPEEVPFGVSPEAFGKDVLHYVERDTTGTVWIGGASCIARIVYALFPQAALVSTVRIGSQRRRCTDNMRPPRID